MSDLFEDRLRQALRQEADTVGPGDRLEEIRGAARRRRPWALPTVAAAAVIALVAGLWLAGRLAQPPPPVPSMLSPNGPMVETVLPVYDVARLAPGSDRYALVKEQRLVWLPWDATPTDRANLAMSTAAQPTSPDPDDAVATWSAATTFRVVAHPGVEVDVAVSEPGRTGLPDRVQELAVQALVWTVTEALGEPYAPVMVYVATGGSIFETVPSNVFTRPADARLREELAPISISAPYSGQRLASTTPVVVQGDACTVEQNVQWVLYRGGTRVSQGHTTAATVSCPEERGTWSVSLGPLAAGDYELRAIEPDAEKGGVIAQVAVPFSVG